MQSSARTQPREKVKKLFQIFFTKLKIIQNDATNKRFIESSKMHWAHEHLDMDWKISNVYLTALSHFFLPHCIILDPFRYKFYEHNLIWNKTLWIKKKFSNGRKKLFTFKLYKRIVRLKVNFFILYVWHVFCHHDMSIASNLWNILPQLGHKRYFYPLFV